MRLFIAIYKNAKNPTNKPYVAGSGIADMPSSLGPCISTFIEPNASGWKEDLNVKPNLPGNMGKSVSFPIYRESAKKLYVPRFYGEKNFGPADEIKLSSGEQINVDFAGEMRPYQNDIINKYLTHVKSGKNGIGGGLLEIGCGKGKTVMALNIISKLKLKTLVIVHKGFLLSQWIERIQQFLPAARIGKIQVPHFDIEDKDIVIGMLQSLSMKEYPEDTFDSFGFTIIDECHHISAEIFVRSLQKIV